MLPNAKCHKCLNPFSYFRLWHLIYMYGREALQKCKEYYTIDTICQKEMTATSDKNQGIFSRSVFWMAKCQNQRSHSSSYGHNDLKTICITRWVGSIRSWLWSAACRMDRKYFLAYIAMEKSIISSIRHHFALYDDCKKLIETLFHNWHRSTIG